MKHTFLFLFLFAISFGAFSKNKDEIKKYDENYRAQYHFSPDVNKMGNPVSVWVKDSTYYVYFQQNTYNLLPGYINWGLTTSTDLLLWGQKGLVIKQPETVIDSMQQVPWTGSVCNSKKGVVAWISRWNDGIYKTESTDGISWGNEIKTIGTEFLAKSEIQVFWYKPTQKWVMVAFDRITTTMFILNSTDGVQWDKTFEFNYTLGFPQLFELNVDRKPDETLWVLATEKGTYMLGNFDGLTFQPKSSVKKFDYNSKIGATTFFTDPKTGKTIGFSAINGEQLADLPSNGQLTVPKEFTLHEFETGIELMQQPVEELNSLNKKGNIWDQKKIYPGIKNNLLKGLKGTELRLKCVIDILNCDQFGFHIRNGRENEGTEFEYNAKKGLINFLSTQFEYTPVNNKIEIEMLIDRSSIEILIDGGRYVMSYQYAPSPQAKDYELYTVGGEIMVDHMEVFPLKSVWREE